MHAPDFLRLGPIRVVVSHPTTLSNIATAEALTLDVAAWMGLLLFGTPSYRTPDFNKLVSSLGVTTAEIPYTIHDTRTFSQVPYLDSEKPYVVDAST